MDQEDKIYVSKIINIQNYHVNIIHSNHGNGTQPNKDFEVYKKHRVNDYFPTLILFMIAIQLKNCKDKSKGSCITHQET